MTQNIKYNTKQYPYSDLTEKLIGIAYMIHRQIGSHYPEKIYQKAFEDELISQKIKYSKENYCKIDVNNKRAGSFRLDFLIEDKVVVELKVRNEIFNRDIAQVLSYLQTKKIKVGLIILFSSSGVKIKRLIL